MFEAVYKLPLVSISSFKLNAFTVSLIVLPVSFIFVLLICELYSKTLSFWKDPFSVIVLSSFKHVFAFPMLHITMPKPFICRSVGRRNVKSFSLFDFVHESAFIYVHILIKVLSISCCLTFLEISNILLVQFLQGSLAFSDIPDKASNIMALFCHFLPFTKSFSIFPLAIISICFIFACVFAPALILSID